MAVAAGQSSAAVCFPGWLGVNVPDAGESIRRHLVVPLGADVLPLTPEQDPLRSAERLVGQQHDLAV